MKPDVPTALAPFLVLLGLACAGPAERRAAGGDRYVFAFLESGADAPELSEQELQEVMLGHFTNMGRMAEAGRLLLAGPFTEPRSDPDHRGLFVLDTDSVAEAGEWVASDPAVAAGVLDADLFPFRSAAPLRALPRLDREDEARRLAEDPDSAWSGRSYVLVSATDGAAAAEALAGLQDGGLVLFSGTFGGELDGSGLFAIDATDPDELRGLFGDLLEDGAYGWELHPWYGSRMVAELPAHAR